MAWMWTLVVVLLECLVVVFSFKTHEVERRKVQGNLVDMHAELMAQRKPVILTHTPAESWGARSLWTLDYLAERVETFTKVHTHDKAEFLYSDGSGKGLAEEKNLAVLDVVANGDHLRAHLQPAYQTRDLPASAVFSALKDVTPSPTHEYVYWSGDISKLGEGRVQEAVPVEPFILNDNPFNEQNFVGLDEVNVWMGGANVTALAHYDKYHNMYVQLIGRKQFRMVPPTNWMHMYVYPATHACDRQSQVDYERPDLKRFPAFAQIEDEWVAVLEPGEVLYLPPFWFHHVKALTPSVSVNIWSNSADSEIIGQILHNPLPYYTTAWPEDLAVLALQYYIPMILNRLLPSLPAYTLKGKGGASSAAKSLTTNQVVLDMITLQYGPLLHLHNRHMPALCSSSQTKWSMADTLQPHVHTISQLFLRLQPELLTVGFALFMESVADVIIGAGHVPGFLLYCLDHENARLATATPYEPSTSNSAAGKKDGL